MTRAAALVVLVSVAVLAAGAAAHGDVRVTRDATRGGYGGLLGPVEPAERSCSVRRRQQVEPSVAVDPRAPRVIAVGVMDACIAIRSPLPIPMAQHWLSYHRSTDGGRTWRASLLPGYPGDRTPGRPAAGCTQQADPSLAFDRQGRLFYGALCPVFDGFNPVDFRIAVATYDRDGARHVRTVRVDRPPTGQAETAFAGDKPNLAVDQGTGRHAGNVYVAWTQCRRVGPAPCQRYQDDAVIQVARSTNGGRSFERAVTIDRPALPFPFFTDVAVGPNGHVYVTFRTDTAQASRVGIWLTRSTDGGRTFGTAHLIQQTPPFDSSLFAGPSNASNCGDGPFRCPFGFKFAFIRTFSAVAADERGVHVAWGGRTPAGQGRVFVVSSRDGVTWNRAPVAVAPVARGHQWWPDVASADGVLSVVFLDSRRDGAYAPARPPGNTDARTSSGAVVDTYVAQSRDGGRTFSARRLSARPSAPNLETYLDARLPWRGDYLAVSAVPGGTFATWPDSRDAVAGRDTRPDSPRDGFDVLAPCGWSPNTVSPPGAYAAPSATNACLNRGGLDLNVYGSALPRR